MGTGSSTAAEMASVTVCNRTIQGRSERIVLNFVNLKGSVYKLKDDISRTVNLPISDIELVYCGQKLDDSKQLDNYGLKPGATLFALRKHISEPPEQPEPLSEVALRQLVATLQTALLNPAYRTTVDRMLNSSEAMQNIIAATPGLEDDPVALSMLEDQELLAILAHPGNIRQVVKKHPAFGQAAHVIAAAVSEEGCHSEDNHNAPGSYSLDQMSDEEDVSPNRQGPSTSSGGNQAITASQLSAALAAATGQPPPGQQSSPNSQAASNILNQGGPLITQDFFQEAIRQAQDTTSQTQIQQLRDMGITDEALARRALQATGGDLRAALDLIFGDGIF